MTLINDGGPSANMQIYDDKCTALLQDNDVRFAGIVNDQGKLIAGGFKKNLVPLEDDETRLHAFLEFVSKVSFRKEYDSSLGPINYIAARRDKAVLISFPFPITKILLLVSAEPSVNIESLANKIVRVFAGIS
jgi:hypothetical protein